MRHQQGQVGMPEHVAGDAAEDQLIDPAVAVGSHHQQIGAMAMNFAQQRLAHGRRSGIEPVGRGDDAVWRKEVPELRFVFDRADPQRTTT